MNPDKEVKGQVLSYEKGGHGSHANMIKHNEQKNDEGTDTSQRCDHVEMWSGKLFHISKNQVANVVHKKRGHPNNWIGYVQVQKHASLIYVMFGDKHISPPNRSNHE